MGWLDDFRADVARYGEGSETAWKAPGLWALLQYRISHAYGDHGVAGLALAGWKKVIEMTTGISIGCHASIEPGCRIGHFGGIFVNDRAVIGSGTTLSQGVAIGELHGGVPRIGRDVYIGPHAVVVGGITIGDGAMIGANTVVFQDVPPRAHVRPAPVEVITAED